MWGSDGWVWWAALFAAGGGEAEAPVEVLAAARPGADGARWGRLVPSGDGEGSFLGRMPLFTAHERLRPFEVDLALEGLRRYLGGTIGRPIAPEELAVVAVAPFGEDLQIHVAQTLDGLIVEGGYAIARIGRDGLRYARHRWVLAGPWEAPLPRDVPGLQRRALAALKERTGARAVTAAGDPVPRVVARDGAPRRAERFLADTQAPFGRWAVHVDALDGAVLGVERVSTDGVAGEVRFAVEPRCEGDPVELLGMPFVRWREGATTTDTGGFASPDPIDGAEVALESPYFRVVDRSGAALAGPWSFALAAAPAYNLLEVRDAPLDQIDPLYHAHRVRNWLRGRVDQENEQKRWSDGAVPINVNVASSCNAFYDGTINFFQAGGGCLNTGRVAAIVYHEYGHGIHDHSGGRFDGQVSEGIADYVAATITGDPDMKGIRGCGRVFRSCVNEASWCGSGCTYGPSSEVHQAGQVICAAWWELRGHLVERYGADQGVATADRLLLGSLGLVGDMGTAYEAAIAADDDDDGDPSNGTRHSCEINRAFADDRPGAAPHFPSLVGRIPSAPSVHIEHDAPGVVEPVEGAPLALRFDLRVEPGCAPSDEAPEAKLYYSVDGRALTEAPVVRSADGAWVAELSVAPPATVDYYLQVDLGAHRFVYPYPGRNAVPGPDYPPYRQTLRYAAEDTIYFSDFERDDGGVVATTCLRDRGGRCLDDGQSDWEWGAPTSLAGGPATARSGDKIWGTDLDGAYDRGRISALHLPPFDARGLAQVRLQLWRRLLSADVARVEVNGAVAWERRAGAFFWRDPIWMFQDLDLSPWAAGQPRVEVSLLVDDGFADSFELAGLHVDDLRIVGESGAAGAPGGPGGAAAGVAKPDERGCDCATSSVPLRRSRTLYALLAAAALFARRRS